MNNAINNAKLAMERDPTPHNINNYLWQAYLHRVHNTVPMPANNQGTSR